MPKIRIPEGVSKPRFWTGLIVAILLVMFLTFDGIAKIVQATPVKDASVQLGLPSETTVPIGLLLLLCTVIYIIPSFTILGAILLTGYLGGAVAIHVRAGNGAFPIAFAVAFGVLVWTAVVLREPRLLRLILLRQWPEVTLSGAAQPE